MSTRKRRGGTINSRQAQKRTREAPSTPEMAVETEPIELEESAGDEIVDLTCESLEPVVVDLTHNDSVVVKSTAVPTVTVSSHSPGGSGTPSVAPGAELSAELPRSIVEDRRRPRRTARRLRQEHTDSCVVSSDDDDSSRDRDVPSGTVSCPICMDGYSEIVQNGRLIVSTECGHVFCSQCLRDALKNSNTCPTCRKKINHKRYHPIYI